MTRLFQNKNGFYALTNIGAVFVGKLPQEAGAFKCAEQAKEIGDPFHSLGKMIQAALQTADYLRSVPNFEISSLAPNIRR